jgi:hypothetical protein
VRPLSPKITRAKWTGGVVQEVEYLLSNPYSTKIRKKKAFGYIAYMFILFK